MMIRRIGWLLCALPLVSVGQGSGTPKAPAGSESRFVIDGNVKGVIDHSLIFVTDASNPTDTLAQTTITGGKFSLSGPIGEPNIYMLNFGGVSKKVPVFIGADKMTMEGSADNLKDFTYKGSPSQTDFLQLQEIFNPYVFRLNAVMTRMNSPEGAIHRDSLFKAYHQVVDSIQVLLDSYIASRKSSYVAPFALLLLNQVTEDVMRQERRLHSLSADVQNGFYGKTLQAQLSEAMIGAIGTDEIDFTQTDTAGNSISLSSFKGKYVLVDFWASWCGPCRMENPNVVETYHKFKGKNFTVLGVSLDKSKDPWLKAIKDDRLVWTQVSDLKYWNNEVAVKYHIQSIPQNYLIDPTGKIVGRNLRGAELQAKLCELLGCN